MYETCGNQFGEVKIKIAPHTLRVLPLLHLSYFMNTTDATADTSG